GLGPGPPGERPGDGCRRVCRSFDGLMQAALGRGEEGLTLVVHGGTVMALMEKYGLPRRSYFQWHIGCGEGLLLQADHWPEEKTLRLLSCRKYTEGK
ncbi:MAG: histidine phosphatase family protein, partial [Oscillospiraceae bacterium]|nr:histidine phosphatase family protein [Oscillospiraceae bacterium]